MQEAQIVAEISSISTVLFIVYYKIRSLEKQILNGQIVERLAKLEEKVNIVYNIIMSRYDDKISKR